MYLALEVTYLNYLSSFLLRAKIEHLTLKHEFCSVYVCADL